MSSHLIVRLWIEGELVVDEHLAVTNAGQMGQQHLALAQQADADGKLWLVELEDPDLPEENRCIRFGSDTSGMIDPTPVDELGA